MQKLALIILFSGCAHTSTLLPHERAAGEAAKQAWAEHGMPPPTRKKRCAIDEFSVVVAKTPAEYNKYCPTSVAEKSAGCLSWTSSAHWFFWRDRPLVVVSPIHYSEPTIVVHELMHAYIQCAELGKSAWDPGDRLHADPRVWRAPGGDKSVQWRADELAKPPAE